MKNYNVTFTFTLQVSAASEEEAKGLAIDMYADEKPYISYEAIDNVELSSDQEPGEIPEFIHSDLHSDFVQNCFPNTGSYKTWVDQTGNSPENFELTIQEDGSGESYEYYYDNKEEAFKDMETFLHRVKMETA